MVWWYTLHGQPSQRSSTWQSCWNMKPACPRQTLPPSHILFWQWCCLYGESEFTGEKQCHFRRKKDLQELPNQYFYRFVVENFVLDKHMRYVLIPYVVVIWALSGNLDKNYDASSPSRNGIFIGKKTRTLHTLHLYNILL